MPPRRSVAAAAWVLVLAAGPLAACAVMAQAQAPVAGVRVQLFTVTNWSDLERLQQRIEQSAGVPARNLVGVSPTAFAVTLQCPDAGACDAARRRLASARHLFDEVSLDLKPRPPKPPPAQRPFAD